MIQDVNKFPRCAVVASLQVYTNSPFAHQRRYKKRIKIVVLSVCDSWTQFVFWQLWWWQCFRTISGFTL